MLWLELIAAAVIIILGRIRFYSFVRKDPFIVLALRYGGFLGILVVLHHYFGSLWAWLWIVFFPAAGLIMHAIIVRKHGLHFFKPGDKYDQLRGWKEK